MFELFKAELQRFRGWAIAYAALHLVVLFLICRLLDPGQQTLLFYQAFAAIYLLSGVVLGVVQMSGYRRGSAWLNLLHRPLAPWRIALALTGAGAVLLAAAIVLPLLAALGYQIAFTARVVDLRHGLLPLAALLLTSCGYLAGSYVTLANRRIAVTAIIFVLALYESRAGGVDALVVQALVLLWLAGLLWTAFKPDLSALPRSLPATLITALPLQMTIMLGFALLALGGEMVWTMLGTDPINMTAPPSDGYVALSRMTGNQRMKAALKGMHDRESEVLRRQIDLSKVYTIGEKIGGAARRGRLTNEAPTAFVDAQRGQRLVFSQDRMRLEVFRQRDGKRVGEIGIGRRQAAFPVPVQPVGTLPGLRPGDQMLFGGHVIYQYDSAAAQVRPRITLPAAETAFDIEPVGAQLAVVSNRAVYFYDSLPLVDGLGAMKPRQRVPLPGKFGDLARLDVVEMVDGYLIDFDLSGGAYLPHGVHPVQVLVHVHDDGRVQTLARRELHQDFPAIFRYRHWLPSPLLYRLGEAGRNLFAPPRAYATSRTPVPAPMWWLAGAWSVIALIGGVWLGARRRIRWRARMAWLAACLVIGVPAWISLWLLYPRNASESVS